MIISTNRLYSGENDLQSMIDLLIAVRPADRIAEYPGVGDLHEAMALTAVQSNTRLWFDAADQLAGFAYVDPYRNLRFEFDRQAASSAIESEIIAWGVECIRRAAQGESLTLDASCRDDDAERVALLERHGFVAQKMRSLYMARSLNAPFPAPQLPDGFTIRHAAGEQEVEALVALHRAAFGTTYMTVEKRLATMRAPDYELELDLVAAAPDGRLAAYCTCSISQEENERAGRSEGYTDPVATHPDFQRRGLAKALMLTGFQKLKARGMDTAVLGTSSENSAMQHAAEALGFCVRSMKLWFEKPVS